MEENKAKPDASEKLAGERLEAIRDIETKPKNRVLNSSLMILMLLVAKNNNWRNGCGRNNFNNFF